MSAQRNGVNTKCQHSLPPNHPMPPLFALKFKQKFQIDWLPKTQLDTYETIFPKPIGKLMEQIEQLGP